MKQHHHPAPSHRIYKHRQIGFKEHLLWCLRFGLNAEAERNKLWRMTPSPESKIQFQYQLPCIFWAHIHKCDVWVSNLHSKSIKACAPGLGRCTKAHHEYVQDGPFYVWLWRENFRVWAARAGAVLIGLAHSDILELYEVREKMERKLKPSASWSFTWRFTWRFTFYMKVLHEDLLPNDQNVRTYI